MFDSILKDADKRLKELRDDLKASGDGETRYHVVAFIVVERKGQRNVRAVIDADDDVCWDIAGRLQRLVYEGDII